MLFNSLEFYIFFPLVTLLYFLLPHKYRWFHLLMASCYFYMAFVPVYLLILGFTIVIDYFAGIWIEKSAGQKRKWFLVASLVANIGILAVFKYYNFFNENITEVLGLAGYKNPFPYLSILLPIGLSFHTFQAMSYTIEVYRGNQKAEKHFGIYSLYVMFYPQLVAGPIERPQNVLHQFHEQKFFSYEAASTGLRLMAWGLFKKLVIADRLALMVDKVYDHPFNHSPAVLLFASCLFAFQIYCDFSGYSDIAIGSARVMGIKLMTNFKRPYYARSISEFWQRWHISLSTWFKDYLYIPLGGKRVAVPRWYFNLFFVFMVSGFWHGASWTFIIWGALHGFYLISAILLAPAFRKLRSLFKLNEDHILVRNLNMFSTFALATFAWIFFRANSVSDALYIAGQVLVALQHLINPEGLKQAISAIYNLFNGKIDIAITLLMMSILWLVHYLHENKRLEPLFSKSTALRWSMYAGTMASIIFFGKFSSQSFIYFQF